MNTWLSVISNVLLAFGTIVVQYGWMTKSEWEGAVGFIIIVITLIWKAVDKKKTLALIRGYEARLGVSRR